MNQGRGVFFFVSLFIWDFGGSVVIFGIEVEKSVDFGLDIGGRGVERRWWWWRLSLGVGVVFEKPFGGFEEVAGGGGESLGG